MYAITAQIVAYLIDAGFPPLQAATAWGFSGVLTLFGMLGISTLDSVIGRRPSVLFSYGVSIVGLILLWLLQYYPNYWLLTGFIICFGSMIGSRGPLITATALNISGASGSAPSSARFRSAADWLRDWVPRPAA